MSLVQELEASSGRGTTATSAVVAPVGPRVAVTRELSPPELSRLAVLAGIVRRSGPHLIEATIVPAVLFYGFLVTAGLGAAYMAALGWSYAALCRRLVCRRPIPPILVLGIIGISVRTLVAVICHSSFVYFFQPILGTLAMGFVFLISVAVGKPLIGRLAGEFWAVTPEVAARPAVIRLYRHLTLLWAAVNVFLAALTAVLLVVLPLGAFLAVKQVSGLAVTAGAVFVTISMSLTIARREGIVAVKGARRALKTSQPRETTVDLYEKLFASNDMRV